MFDKIEVHEHKHVQASAYPQTVHEHKAPTDESIKLYAELLAKAREEVARVVVNDLPDNVLSHAVLHTHRDLLQLKQKVRIVFKLNGVMHDIEVNEDFEETRRAMAQVIVRALLDRVSDQLWRELPGQGSGLIR